MPMGTLLRISCDSRFRKAFALTVALLALVLIPTQSAYADIADDINGWLSDLLRDAANWMFSKQVEVLKGIGYDGILGADFNAMLTTSGSISMYDIAHGVWQVAILPIGCGVLSLVFTIKLIQISQRVDGNASMPGVKEVVFLLVFYAVFLFLIQHSFELMQAIYEVIGIAIDRVIGLFGQGDALDVSAVSIVTTDGDIPALLAMLIVSLISWVVVLAAYIIALVVCWARPATLHHGGVQPHPAGLHGARRHPPNRSRLPEELHGGVHRGPHHRHPPDRLPANPGRNRRREPRHGNPHRRGRERAHLRATVPRHVHPAHPLAREERGLGPGYRERFLRERRT